MHVQLETGKLGTNLDSTYVHVYNYIILRKYTMLVIRMHTKYYQLVLLHTLATRHINSIIFQQYHNKNKHLNYIKNYLCLVFTHAGIHVCGLANIIIIIITL